MDFTARKITQPELLKTDCIVVPVFADGKLDAAGRALDEANGGLLTSALSNGELRGKVGQAQLLHCQPEAGARRVLLLGCGKASGPNEKNARKIIATLLKTLLASRAREACLLLEPLQGKKLSYARFSSLLAVAAVHSSYRYRETLSKPGARPKLKKILLATSSAAVTAQCKAALLQGQKIGDGINYTRQLGNLPANICTPTYLAEQAGELGADDSRFSLQILEEAQMRELGMGALLSVSAGSDEPAKLIVMEYRGADDSHQPYVLVGKGITFDSGGISLKPGAKMDEMKFDMCGAATVLGVMQSVLAMQLPLNVIGIIATSENMPSGAASKPGDVVTSMSGQTIEILNTDAEGRLVLCDALTYAERFKPAAVIDIATLTGACVVALGSHATGMYSNHNGLARQLRRAGTRSHDRVWRMPLWEDYQKQLKTNFADMANIGSPGAGSVTAACFLARFTKKYRWAHLDIAGTAWHGGGLKGATGRPAGMLLQFLMERAADQ